MRIGGRGTGTTRKRKNDARERKDNSVKQRHNVERLSALRAPSIQFLLCAVAKQNHRSKTLDGLEFPVTDDVIGKRDGMLRTIRNKLRSGAV